MIALAVRRPARRRYSQPMLGALGIVAILAAQPSVAVRSPYLDAVRRYRNCAVIQTNSSVFFQEFLDDCNHNLFMDSNLGRSAFAWGAGAVLARLQDNFSKRELKKILEEFSQFTDAYLEKSR
jgi:hypothetical protein